jgi:nucleotidyltransferase substrate binding protein (TIGR01987 family)
VEGLRMNIVFKKYTDARNALNTLEEILSLDHSLIQRDASLQRFEYTVEAVWKCLKIYLETQEGITCVSPKACFREAKNIGILSDEECELTLNMVDDRNLTTHTYHAELAERIYAHLKEYAAIMKKILDYVRKNIDG